MTSPQQRRATGAAATATATALIAAQQFAISQLRGRVLAYIQRAWRSLPAYRDEQIPQFVRTVTPIVQAGQRQTASITDAYLSRMYAEATGEPLQLTGVPEETFTRVRGIDLAQEYERPFHQVWTDLSQGKDFQAAAASAEKRALDLAATDLQLAKTHASRHVLSDKGRVVGYRRVLEGTYSCGLCVVASTQRYHTDDLMEIHPQCDCSVAPIIGEEDPGQIINEPLLAAAHQTIKDTFGLSDAGARDPDYRHLIIVHEHGELGPLLARRGDRFTGPADIQAS